MGSKFHSHLVALQILFEFLESRFPRTKTTPALGNSNHRSPYKGPSLDLSEDSMAQIQRELEVEEKIVAAARRMAELPSGNRRERQKRKQSLQQ